MSGFDLTLTPAKSVSIAWGVGDQEVRSAILAAHQEAVRLVLDLLERTALRTRTGARGCVQQPTRGALAAAFDHWDSRAGDPNLHTHLVLANKVQTADGRWLSVDSRALHHAVVALSEMYDDFLADEVARRLPVSWSWRPRGPRRSPAFEVDGVPAQLMREFSTRTSQIDEAMTATVAKFHADHGRGPTRVEVSRLRQQVTRATRPGKHVRPLSDLVAEWRDRAAAVSGTTPEELVEAVMQASKDRVAAMSAVPEEAVEALAAHALGRVMERRSTWTRWNVMAEAARATRGLRMASPAEREALVERTCDAVMARCVSLEPPDPLEVPARYRRPDGTSVFSRPGEVKYTHRDVLVSEQRLLDGPRGVITGAIA